MHKKIHPFLTRMTALLLVLVCVLGLLPATALAAPPDTIKLEDCSYNGVQYDSPALGTCHLQQMRFNTGGKSTMGFCAEKGKGMGHSLEGHTWGNPQTVSDPTVTTLIHFHYHDDVTTGADGRAVLTNIPVDSYEVIEKSVPDPYVVGDEPSQTIYLGPGENRELIFDNLKQPVLKISKVEKGTNTPIPGTVFTVEGIDSDYRHDVTTGADGFATLRVAPGSYRVTEKSVPDPYCLPEDEADRVQTISLNGGDEKTLNVHRGGAPVRTA